ncbi:MAG: hypothetical protein ACXVA9_10380 [Bdellovibrionales bacterium]
MQKLIRFELCMPNYCDALKVLFALGEASPASKFAEDNSSAVMVSAGTEEISSANFEGRRGAWGRIRILRKPILESGVLAKAGGPLDLTAALKK